RTGTSPRRPRTSGKVGAAAQASLALEYDHGDHALRPRRVLVVVGPDLVHQLPEPLALLAVRHTCAGAKPVAPDLDADLGRLGEVLEPAGMIRRAALRRDDHRRIAVEVVDEQRRRLLACAAAGLGQEKNSRA